MTSHTRADSYVEAGLPPPDIIEFGEPSLLLKHEARKLGHILEPERTRLWLDMIFRPQTNSRIELTSLWDAYDNIFRSFGRENAHLDTEEWLDCIKATLPYVHEGTEVTSGNEDTVVDYLEGMMFRDEIKPYHMIMKDRAGKKRRAAERRVRKREVSQVGASSLVLLILCTSPPC